MSGVNRGIVIRQLDRLWSEGSLTGLGEAQLLERYRRGRDESAFEALVDRHGPMVLGLCRRMLRDPRDIEDAFQATFLVLVRKASSIRDGALLANWLYGVAYRVANRARRTRLRRADREVSLELLSQPPATRSTQSLINELGPALDEELARLPDKYRTPIVLCYLNGKTHDQVADLLNCPVGTIHTRINRGRNMLRTRLTRRGCAPTAAVLSLSPSWSIPFTAEAVPPSLIFATINAAGQLGSSQVIKAGLIASSVVSLTQGAITSMNIATWKWAGLGLMATAVSASGVVAVGYASGPGLQAEQGRAVALALPDGPQKRGGSAVEPADEPPERTESATGGAQVIFPNLAKTQPNEQLELSSTIRASLPELSTRLEIALDQFDVINATFRTGQISAEKLIVARGEVLLAEAKFKGLVEQLRDQLQQLEDQRTRKLHDLDEATKQKEVAESLVGRIFRLSQRKAAVETAVDVAKAKSDLRAAASVVDELKGQMQSITDRMKTIERLQILIHEAMSPFSGRIKTARSGQQQARNSETIPPQAPANPAGNDNDTLTEAMRPRPNKPVNADPARGTPDSTGTFLDLRFRPVDGTTNLNIRLLQLQLEHQLEDFEKTPMNAATQPESRREITYYATVLDSMLADLNEQLAHLEVQLTVKRSELAIARTNEQNAAKLHAFRKALLEQKAISDQLFLETESGLSVAKSKVLAAEAYLSEPELRITQLTRKKERLQTLLNRATKILNQPAAAPSPSMPR